MAAASLFHSGPSQEGSSDEKDIPVLPRCRSGSWEHPTTRAIPLQHDQPNLAQLLAPVRIIPQNCMLGKYGNEGRIVLREALVSQCLKAREQGAGNTTLESRAGTGVPLPVRPTGQPANTLLISIDSCWE